MGKKEPEAPAGKSSRPSAISKGKPKKGGWPEKNTPARTELVRELKCIVSIFASTKQPVRGKQCAKHWEELYRELKVKYDALLQEKNKLQMVSNG